MNILITGGTGLIGTPLVQKLISLGHQVTVLSRSPQKVYSHFCKAVECWTTLNDVNHLNDFDAVINLAGEPIAEKRWTDEQKKRLCDSRWKITQRLAELIAASETPPCVFLSGSAVGYYGDQAPNLSSQKMNNPTTNLPINSRNIGKPLLKMPRPTKHACVYYVQVSYYPPNGGVLGKILPIFKMGAGGNRSRQTIHAMDTYQRYGQCDLLFADDSNTFRYFQYDCTLSCA